MKEHAKKLHTYVGRRRTEHDTVVPSQAQAMAALLDRDPSPYSAGAPLPEFWHWIYFKSIVRRSRLGEDGHQHRGDFLPPVELPRRMWAGGRLQFHNPIIIGEEIERTSEIISVDKKSGRSGELVVITVKHVISSAHEACVKEEQDIVYCEIPRSDQPGPQTLAPTEVNWKETFLPDAIVLFYYSALMFNAHRIHYDYPFTTQVEGYRGLLVHGPLTGLLLLDAATRYEHRMPASYAYRGAAPLFCDEPITLAGINTANDDTQVWASGPDGVIAMEARVIWK
ncbi:MAG: MaoC family dehydratase N-terminal domain-containing protein [Acidiferrobacterales bacterium]